MPCGSIYELNKEWGNYVLHNFPICIKDIKLKSNKSKSHDLSWKDFQRSAASWDIYDFKLHCSQYNR